MKTAEARITSQDFPLLCDLYPGGSVFSPPVPTDFFFSQSAAIFHGNLSDVGCYCSATA